LLTETAVETVVGERNAGAGFASMLAPVAA